jgi:hypothetical protein
LIAIGVIRLLAGLLDALFFVGTGGGVTSAATLDALFFVGTGGGVTSILSTVTSFLFSQVTFPSASSPVPKFSRVDSC